MSERVMDPSATYTNHAGEVVEMRVDGLWHYGQTDLHDYSWAYDAVADRVSAFRRAPRDFSMLVHMQGGSAAERDRVTDVFEADVAALVPGTLRVGYSEMRCWVTASAKASWWFSDGAMDATLTVHADDPVWTRSVSVEVAKPSGATASGGFDYPHDYPFDYRVEDHVGAVSNPFPTPAALRLTVYGPAVDPYVIVGGNRYQVDVSLGEGGLLFVDGLARTITTRSVTGHEEDAFAAGVREAGANVFARVPAGQSAMSWDGSFGFAYELVEERSEPAWAPTPS